MQEYVESSGIEDSSKVVIRHGNDEEVLTPPVEREQVRAFARKLGFKLFTLQKEDGGYVTASSYPLSEGTYILAEYNEAK